MKVYGSGFRGVIKSIPYISSLQSPLSARIVNYTSIPTQMLLGRGSSALKRL